MIQISSINEIHSRLKVKEFLGINVLMIRFVRVRFGSLWPFTNVGLATNMVNRCTLIIDDVVDRAFTVEEDAQRVVEFDAWLLGSRNSGGHVDGMVSEERVNSHTPGFVVGYTIANFVGSKS